ncbi:MAG: UvrD-helicase domain-containing protein, partial [Pseudomonadota bacterium]
DAAAADDEAARGFLDDLGALAVRHGDTRAADIVGQLLRARRALQRLGGNGAVAAAVRRLLDIPDGAAPEIMAAAIAEDPGLLPALDRYAEALSAWSTKTGIARLDTLSEWLLLAADERAAHVDLLFRSVFTADGTGKPFGNMKKVETELLDAADRVAPLRDLHRRLSLAEIAGLHLRVGRALSAEYEAAKTRLGALDYDDLIEDAAALLSRIDAAWVLYKLDQRIDHVLVDEGQDTNASQWRIVDGLVQEFFAGAGRSEEGSRTQFAVGDFKQAIFGFQGTDPAEFRRARERTAGRAGAAGNPLEEIGLNRSFRSVPAILTVVDQVLAMLGPEALGVDRAFEPHEPHRDLVGAVTLWPRLADADGEVPEDYRQNPERELARRIAGEVGGWLRDRRFIPSRGRAAEPQDVLILVRSRGDLVRELVAALHAENVPVAGADRLRLKTPLAVRDCLSLVRFALQPDDDLTLAELLVSPFLGWSQDELYELAQPRGERETLWLALKRADGEAARRARDWLDAVLAMADFTTPYDFLEAVLSGPLGGRARLLKRLGEEARDPLEELLTQALAYERVAAPSLEGFLDWLAAADDIDIKRDPDAPSAAVRIMTVHGAKGLQAPIVVMADAARTHGEGRKPPYLVLDADDPLPLYGIEAAALPDMLTGPYEAETERERQESLRLLYVAMTRAEDYLFVGGLPARRQVTTWYDIIHAAMAELETEEIAAPTWDGFSLRHA